MKPGMVMMLVASVVATGALRGEETAFDAAPIIDRSPTRGALWAAASPADQARAGCPQSVRPHAGRALGPGRVGYYVGGGAVVKGDRRDPARDGTWGLDYQPRILPRLVDLQWNRGTKYQGGQGAYRTDGPKLRHE